MVFTLPAGTFPALHLTAEDQRRLADEAACIVQETITANEDFIAHGRELPRDQWKLLRARESFQIYRERLLNRTMDRSSIFADAATTSSSRSRSSVFQSQRSSSQDSSWSKASRSAGSSAQTKMPTVIGYGTVEGTLDDIMLGAFAADDAAWRVKSTYVKDRFDDAKFLATIHGPTEEDPFRFLGVKWFTVEYPAAVSTFMQRRDFLIMEATGLTTGADGNQIGYSLYQSIKLSEIHELRNLKIIRGYTSVCFLNRAGSTPGTLELFCRATLDIYGRVPFNVGALIMSETIFASLNVMECAYMKKLLRLVHQRTRDTQLGLRETQTSADSIAQSSSCRSCKRTVNKRFRSMLSGAKCSVCREVSNVSSECDNARRLLHHDVDSLNAGICRWCAPSAVSRRRW